MGLEMPTVGKKEGKKTIEELSLEAYRIAREYKMAAEGRGAQGSEEHTRFLSARLRLQEAIKRLEKRGVARENLQDLYKELEYPQEMR